jgi:hypothetical protein
LMIDETWAAIDALFARWPQARATSIDPVEFDQAMVPFGNIDPDYREFVLRYGGAIAGPTPIYGLRRAEFMGTIGGYWTAPTITEFFRNKKWPATGDWFIFSIDHGGNPVGFAKDGTVWLSDQMDFGQIVQIASGFEDYLLKWCLKVRKVC